LGLDLRLAALLGAILIVTGPTVVAPLLRLIKPSRKVSSILKWEGIVIDPVGAILAVLVFQVALHGGLHEARETVLITTGKTLLVGVAFAYLIGKLIVYLLKKHWIPDYLESVFLLATVAGAFAASNFIQSESGLLTVTVLGIVMANQKDVPVKHILEFKEHLRVLIISLLFILLSGRIELHTLGEVAAKGGLFLLALIVIIRPASILISNLFSNRTTLKEQLFVSAVAPRGIVAAAVTSIFALEVEHAAHEGHLDPILAEQAHTLVPIVFIVIIGTVAIYGLLAVPLAKILGISKPNPQGVVFAGADAPTRMIAKALHNDGHQVLLLDTQYEKIADAKIEGLPAIRANILSEYAEEEIDFAGIGQLIAATPNDGVNSLATKEFSHLFGRVNVWQISPHDKDSHHQKAAASHMRGRLCYSQAPTFQDLERKVYQGHVIKKTTITEVFTLSDFHEIHGKEAPILFLNDPVKGLRPAQADLTEITADTTIYALVSSQE